MIERDRYIHRKQSEIDEAIEILRSRIDALIECRKWIEIEYDLEYGKIESEPVSTAKGTTNA